jgi:hypothetical protein
MIKKNNYLRDLNDEEIEEIKYFNRLFKKYRMNLKIQIYIFFLPNMFKEIFRPVF